MERLIFELILIDIELLITSITINQSIDYCLTQKHGYGGNGMKLY